MRPATLFDMLHLTHIAANIDGEGNLQPVEPLAVELSVPYTPVARTHVPCRKIFAACCTPTS